MADVAQVDQPGADAPSGGRLAGRGGMLAIAVVVLAAIIGFFVWHSSGRQSTDDAQIDGHITQVSSRVGGPILKLHVQDNQFIAAGALIAEIDPRDYQVAVDRARAELADAQANAAAATSGIPITEVSTATGTRSASGGLEEAQAGVGIAESQIDASRAQLVAAQAHQREREATATRTARDVERLKGLVAKEEIPQQQYDAAVAAADAARAAADASKSDVLASQAAIGVAEQRARQSRGAAAQAQAAVQATRTAPQQLKVTQARAAMAEARVKQAESALAQAEMNLERTRITAPASGIINKKSVEVGQVIQPGQPLVALVSQDDLWVTANFKETQLKDLRPGQKATVSVDAVGKDFDAHVDSIAPATGARFSLLPPENATGNYVKVVQRVPVKIVIEPGQDPEHRLRPGMSATPTVRTSSK